MTRRKLFSVPADWQNRLERQKQWARYQRWCKQRARERSIAEFEDFCLKQIVRITRQLQEREAVRLGPQLHPQEIESGQLNVQKRGQG